MIDQSLFIDSSAHSVYTQGVEIDIYDYIEFLRKETDAIDVYANLDVIAAPGKKTSDKESAELTLQNQRIMEEAGLNPIPVFHRGEPDSFLQYYCQNYEYVGIGTGPPTGSKNLMIYWLDRIFNRYICDDTGMPKIKVHGFGISRFDLMIRYPWYSVDSTTWIQYAAYGQIVVPQKRNGVWSYTKRPHLVRVSTRKSGQGKQAIPTMSDRSYIKKLVLEYLQEKGFELGESHWENRNEIVIEPGVCNNFGMRAELNAMYFMDFADSLPEWPWSMY